MDIAIQCRGLRKTYEGKVEAVRGLDLTVATGECFGLLGPNGAGKTTTIEILEGLLAPTSGEVQVLGRTWQSHPRELREWLGISLQETRLSEKLTVRETLELFASFYRGQPRWTRCWKSFRCRKKRMPGWGNCPGGQKQRLAVATALIANPKILFLDEPTTGLDPQSRRQLWDIIRQFQRRNGTVMLTTHYMDEAERLCDRLAIMDHGQIIAEGTPAELIERLTGHHVVEFAVSECQRHRRQAWSVFPACSRFAPKTDCFTAGQRAARDHSGAALGSAEAGPRLVHLTTRQASLEDVFVQLTGRHLAGELMATTEQPPVVSQTAEPTVRRNPRWIGYSACCRCACWSCGASRK